MLVKTVCNETKSKACNDRLNRLMETKRTEVSSASDSVHIVKFFIVHVNTNRLCGDEGCGRDDQLFQDSSQIQFSGEKCFMKR